jgi:hypothetical protein
MTEEQKYQAMWTDAYLKTLFRFDRMFHFNYWPRHWGDVANDNARIA